MSNRTTGRFVGALFLAAFVCYGVGSALVDRPVGAALMLLNSVVVATIGALVFGIFRPRASQNCDNLSVRPGSRGGPPCGRTSLVDFEATTRGL